MTQKRKAELQRKLSMAPVAKPPSGLAERIKADIPEYLRPERDRDRFSQSWAFTLRVAASIILLVTSVFLTMQLISRDGDVLRVDTPERGAMNSVAEVPPPPPPPAAMASSAEPQSALEPRAIAPAAVRQEAKEERRARPLIAQPEGKVAQKAEAGAAPSTQHAAPSTQHSAPSTQHSAPSTQHAAPSTQHAAQVGSVAGVVESTAAVADRIVVTAEAPAAPPRPASLPEPAVVAESHTDAALASAQNAPRASASLPVARLQRPLTSSSARPFGISTDPSVLGKLKASIERGDSPKQVDVAAVVNHFAGVPASVDDVRLQVEASQAPLKADGTAVIRYTIDTPATLASAEVSIVLEKGVIATHRTIAGPRSLTDPAAGSLRAGQSATGLVELKLEPGTPDGQRVATVILMYTSPSTKRPVRVATDIRAESLNLTWAAASRRHRLATLSAAWGESLSSAQVVDELILTAARLAREAPADPLAQELATVTASSRPRSSGPTGSGG